MQPSTAPPRTRLLWAVLAVVLVHGWLLAELPLHLALPSSPQAAPTPLLFETRTLAVAPVTSTPSNPPPTPIAAPVQRAKSAAVHVRPTEPGTSQTQALAAAPEPLQPAPIPAPSPPALAPQPQMPAVPPDGSADATGAFTLAAAAGAATAPAAAPAAEKGAARVRIPEPVQLVFEGRGQEKNGINYFGSAELVWKTSGSQYDARLDISALGFRLVTWTSKGELGALGLAPRRFGDRRRGPETATHFQRDKGIISFSANNPEVPLLAGAQDKLSTLLQLSALVAGNPQRFAQGGNVEFQAADAHRAELWNFVVSPAQPLELPGGTVSAIKFDKAPNQQYDQRVEVWISPDVAYLPVRLRITEGSGTMSDLLWKRSQKPD